MNKHAVLELSSSIDEAYQCSIVTLNFEKSSLIRLHDMRLIAYAHFNATKFPEDQEYTLCRLDFRTSNLVPIVVGVCLAALVITVLIAYLIGRARAKRQGYASV
ncbi:unnamed protein product [Thelazia callipaeda]|uniref:Lysosome-associated membrane glycoprotein 1 n=1 Tax=Thelazia callipaeda TaxID=103827 RepID=A0A0N5D4G1_THECL|nr:unnamed protein product [Thelazia callipaeda]